LLPGVNAISAALGPQSSEFGDDLDWADEVPIELLELFGGHPKLLVPLRAGRLHRETLCIRGVNGKPRYEAYEL